MAAAVGLTLVLGLPGTVLSADSTAPKNTFNIMMNYELGMHCTGFEFAYCCVLPPYNSILAQVVKTQRTDKGQGAFAKLLEGDPVEGLDGLGPRRCCATRTSTTAATSRSTCSSTGMRPSRASPARS
jgi:hypothetical protein